MTSLRDAEELKLNDELKENSWYEETTNPAPLLAMPDFRQNQILGTALQMQMLR